MIRKTRIILVRHGQTEWNSQNRLQGHKNSPLTKKGEKQAMEVRDALRRYDIHSAYVSPLPRALATMEIILKSRELKASISNNLKEISLGPWEGKTRAETKKSHPEQYEQFWYKQHEFWLSGAETYGQLQKRLVSELNEIFIKDKGKTILVVSHWIAIKVALAHYASIPLERISSIADPENGKFSTLISENGHITVDGI